MTKKDDKPQMMTVELGVCYPNGTWETSLVEIPRDPHFQTFYPTTRFEVIESTAFEQYHEDHPDTSVVKVWVYRIDETNQNKHK